MIVVEIGCGEYAGPFYDDANEHFIVDTDMEALERAATNSPELTPVYGRDATDLGFPDSSVNVVLARNVFGDPFLGVDKRTADWAVRLQTSMFDDENTSELSDLNSTLMNMQYPYKRRIASEAGRVLSVGGKLIAIEQYTPFVAEKFFRELTADLNGTPDLRYLTMPITDAVPVKYASKRSTFTGYTAIVGTKIAI